MPKMPVEVTQSIRLDESEVVETAYLISRGVRPLALLESVVRDDAVMQHAFDTLNQASARYENVIPFVLPRQDMDCAMTGFAAAPWVVDLLAWSYGQPLRQHHQIIGLLLGYSVQAIGEHDAREFVGRPSTRSTSR